jgi:hypothetical protein
MANFTDPIKAAFGRYLHGFHRMLIADTPALAEYAERQFAKAAVWAPGRMIDQVEDMLAAWRKNDTSGEARATPYLPILIAACSKDYMPAQPDYSRQAADAVDVMIPGDPKERVFKMRTALSEVRVQVAVIAADDPTARSIAMQLQLYSSAIERRRIYAEFKLAGVDTKWPFVWKEPDVNAISMPQEVKNLTVLTVDFNGVASVPLLSYPKAGDVESDGQGSGTYQDPPGYLTVQQADIASWPDVDPDAEAGSVEPVRTTVGSLT